MAHQTRTLDWVAMLALGMALQPAPVTAGCNNLPEEPVSFQGTLGRINRAIVRSAAADLVTLSLPDTDRLKSTAGARAGEPAVQVTLIFKPPNAPPSQVVIASPQTCERLEPKRCSVAEFFCPRPSRCLSAASARLVVASVPGATQVGFQFPEIEAAGPLTIAVTPDGQQAPAELGGRSCAEVLGSEQRTPLLGCIDSLAPVATQASALSVSPPCPELVALPQSNDYREVCGRDVGLAPKCGATASAVRFTVCTNGDVSMPVTWSNILRVTGGSYDTRQLLGSSSVSAFASPNAPIRIPSSQFLQSVTNIGTGFTPAPQFHPFPSSFRPNEVTVFGTADKGDSVLYFRRRLLWGYACAGGTNANQACEPSPQEDVGQVDCPDTSGAAGPCTSRTPAYFTCSAGLRQGMPCTRPGHCPGGSCVAGSVCVGGQGAATSTPCQTDADCGTGQECGLGLFEFRQRLANGLGVLPRVASASFPGVCNSGPNEGASCTASSQCRTALFDPARCVGYRAEADQYLP